MSYPPGYELIEAIHAEFVLRSGLGSFPDFGIGRKAIPRHGPMPRIVFVDVGGALEMGGQGAKTGGTEGDLAIDSTVWEVYVWAEGRAQALELYYELIRSIRIVVDDGNAVNFEGNYTLSPEDETNRGRLLTNESLVIRQGVAKTTTYDFTEVVVGSFETEAGTASSIPSDPTDAELKATLGTGKITVTQPSE